MGAPLSSVEMISAQLARNAARQLPSMAQLTQHTSSQRDLTEAFSITYNHLESLSYSAGKWHSYIQDIFFKWIEFVVDTGKDELMQLPASILRVLLMDIWKDVSMIVYGPGGE